jgi:hypothetical protein
MELNRVDMESIIVTEKRLPLSIPRADFTEWHLKLLDRFPEILNWDLHKGGDILRNCLRARNIDVPLVIYTFPPDFGTEFPIGVDPKCLYCKKEKESALGRENLIRAVRWFL